MVVVTSLWDQNAISPTRIELSLPSLATMVQQLCDTTKTPLRSRHVLLYDRSFATIPHHDVFNMLKGHAHHDHEDHTMTVLRRGSRLLLYRRLPSQVRPHYDFTVFILISFKKNLIYMIIYTDAWCLKYDLYDLMRHRIRIRIVEFVNYDSHD